MNKDKSKAKTRKKRKKKISLKTVFAFILFEIVFTAIVGPFFLYYGPFENVKKGFVGSAMTSYKSQFLATWFLSEERINKILAENNNDEEIPQDVESKEIEIPKTHDETIERYDIDGGDKFKGYLLIVKDPTRVKVGYSSKLGKEGQTLSQIIEDNDAIAGINAGGFANGIDTGTGGQPEGIILQDGKVVFKGIDDDQKTDAIAINKDGRLIIGKYSLNELKELGAKEMVSFPPPLVLNGKPTTRDIGSWGIAPRTAIGQRSDGSIMLLVIDGRQLFGSVGASLKEVQDLLIEYGAVNAANLDGGKSATMYYEDEVINTPSDALGERSIPTAFIVK